MKIVNASDIIGEVCSKILNRDGKTKELSIDFLPELDKKIWGFKKQKLVVIGGRTSQGKSNLLLQMAHSFAMQNKIVVFFSLEMTNEVCIERLLSNQCEIDNYLIYTGGLAKEWEKYSTKVNEFRSKMETTKLILAESMGRTFPEIFNVIEAFDKPVDVVIIDYIQMIKTENFKTKRDAIGEYIKQLRNYAIEKNFCAIIGSQINRSTHEGHKLREPEIWELKETGELEEHSDMVLLCHWEYFYTYVEKIREKFWIRIAKNRDGRTGTYYCQIQPEFNRFIEGGDYGRKTDEPKETLC